MCKYLLSLIFKEFGWYDNMWLLSWIFCFDNSFTFIYKIITHALICNKLINIDHLWNSETWISASFQPLWSYIVLLNETDYLTISQETVKPVSLSSVIKMFYIMNIAPDIYMLPGKSMCIISMLCIGQLHIQHCKNYSIFDWYFVHVVFCLFFMYKFQPPVKSVYWFHTVFP